MRARSRISPVATAPKNGLSSYKEQSIGWLGIDICVTAGGTVQEMRDRDLKPWG